MKMPVVLAVVAAVGMLGVGVCVWVCQKKEKKRDNEKKRNESLLDSVEKQDESAGGERKGEEEISPAKMWNKQEDQEKSRRENKGEDRQSSSRDEFEPRPLN